MDMHSMSNLKSSSLQDQLEMFCEFCYKDGKSAQPAAGFCEECVTYFCATCLKYHTKFHPNHTQQDKKGMPQDFYKQMCAKHANELVKFYCLTCNLLACSICKINSHIHCQEIEHLPKLAKDFDRVEEFHDIVEAIDKAKREVAELEMMIESGLDKVKQNKTNAKVAINQDRREINEIFDNLESQVDEAETNDNKKLETAKREITAIRTKVKTLKSVIENTTSERQKSKVFVVAKNAKFDSQSIMDNLYTFKTKLEETEICKYKYKPFDKSRNQNKNGLMATREKIKNECSSSSVWSLAVLILAVFLLVNHCEDKVIPQELKLTFDPATLSYLSTNKLLIKANSQNTLYTVDKTEEKTEKNQQATSVYNYAGSTKVKDEVVIMFTDGNIVPYTMNGQDIYSRRNRNKYMHVEKNGQHLVYRNDTYFILYGGTDSHVNMYDKHGDLLKNILIRDKIQILSPWNIAVSNDNNIIYVTDSDSVVMLTMDGEIIDHFRHVDLIRPRGMTTDKDGNLYVCGYLSNNVFKISPDLSHGYEIFGERHGIQHPFSISYNEEGNELAVGCFDRKSVQIFKLCRTWFQDIKSFFNLLTILYKYS